MIGVLIAAGLVFYAVMYSGIRAMRGDPITTLDALLGRDTTETGKPPTETT